MDTPDVGILHCEDATEWSTSLIRSIGSNFEDMRVFSQKLEDLSLPLNLAKIGFFLRIKAQIVIMSPDLLRYITNNPEVILGQLFDPSRVMAFICGVDDSDFLTMHRANLLTFDAWKKIYYVPEKPDLCVLDMLSWVQGVLSVDHVAESGKKSKAAFKLHPNKVREDASKVIIETLEKVGEGQTLTVNVETDTESISLKAVLRNPYTAKFVLPARFFDVSQIVHITVKCGGKSMGTQPLKCESRMGEMNNLLHTILHPLSFMCQTLGLAESRIDDLDHILTKVAKKNIPKCGFSLLDLSTHIDRQKVDIELPTLLHFSSKMGLKELSAVLLDCPGGEAACRLRNVNDHTPADLAEMEGHTCLAGLLESYSSMSETAEIYICMQRMTEDVNNKNYENLSTTFRRSIEHGFQCSVIPRPLSNNDACTEGAVGGKPLPTNSYTNIEFNEQLTNSAQPETSAQVPNLHLYGQSQRELIQLIEDFKEDKYSIEQVEVLFQSWQQKQHSRSFHEKQQQLAQLREQYERIQNQCQEKTKKKSALERFRSMLVRNNKKDETNSTPVKAKAVYKREKAIENEDTLPDLRVKQRPCSTWSCGSTSSSMSDRSSTMSGTSDSGTLSDIGEEKHIRKRSPVEEPRQAQSSSPSMAFDNRQYLFSSKPPPPAPSKKPALKPSLATSQNPPKPSSPKIILQPPSYPSSKPILITQASVSNRKPMPPPREFPEDSNQLHPTPAVQFLQNKRKTSLTSQGNSASAQERNPLSDDYVPMDSARPVPGRHPSEPYTNAPIVGDSDYYNQAHVDYMVMESERNVEFPPSVAENPSRILSSNYNAQATAYANVPDSTSELDSDRCDSVPEMFAPPPPTLDIRQRPSLPTLDIRQGPSLPTFDIRQRPSLPTLDIRQRSPPSALDIRQRPLPPPPPAKRN